METKQRWRLIVIVLVLLFALYNIFPTALYYSKPLTSPIGEKESEQIAKEVASRITHAHTDIIDRLKSFGEESGIAFTQIAFDDKDSSTIVCKVASEDDLSKAKALLPYLGMSATSMADQFFLAKATKDEILLVRHPIIAIPAQEISSYFSFFPLSGKNEIPTASWIDISTVRFEKLLAALQNPLHLRGDLFQAAQENGWEASFARLSRKIADWNGSFARDGRLEMLLRIALRPGESKVHASIQRFLERAEAKKRELHSKLAEIETKTVDDKKLFLEEEKLQGVIALFQRLAQSPSQEKIALPSSKEIEAIIRKNTASFAFPLKSLHPFFSLASLDMARNLIELERGNVRVSLQSASSNSADDALRTMFLEEMARISEETGEKFDETGHSFDLRLTKENTTLSVLAFNLSKMAKQESLSAKEGVLRAWEPKNVNLHSGSLPLVDSDEYQRLPKESRDMCLFFFSPSEYAAKGDLPKTSLFVVFKGGQKLLEYAESSEGAREQILDDIKALQNYLQARGFVQWGQDAYQRYPDMKGDIVFELDRFYEPVLEASMESFYVPSKENIALLEFSTVQQRVKKENEIDDAVQEALVKEKEAWQAAQSSPNSMERWIHPKPLKNVFWENMKRSLTKYFRGDESRVLHWGLDLSGGVSIRVGLVDSNNRPVTDSKDLKQTANELYARLNKMGVSERTIRVENETISIDFPGGQGVSAEELIKASSMTFHVVNEKFSPSNQEINKQAHAFLQEVWNEATVLGTQDQENINRIAWKKWDLVKRGLQSNQDLQALIDNGLVLEEPGTSDASSSFDESVSIIARYRDQDLSSWGWQGHPLLIVFKNYALEGGNLSQVQPSYDPMKGNVLQFSVRGSDSKGRDFSPQEAFYTWTSQFCQEEIQGTSRELASRGQGWRMAVLLNGYVVSSPHLHSALKEHAIITGNFSQRDVQRLAQDLQAGSLSFTPKILSEENVSPELGAQERTSSIFAAFLGVGVVLAIMISYYRFAGIIASVAVIFNILLLWAVLQNIDAVITLPALAGFVLTIALSVDANVLVFERIREELKAGASLASSVALGYKRAFSAIIDSNLTTIIAAFVLLQFDSGPVKGFALTLIIGILASMFTALFVTRFCFDVWIARSKERSLSMAQLIKECHVPFLNYTKPFVLSMGAFIIGSLLLISVSGKSMLGMDFTGGYSVVIEEPLPADTSLKTLCEKALMESGLHASDFHIRVLGRSDSIRLQLSSRLDEKGGLFAEVQGHEKLSRLVAALKQQGLKLEPQTKDRMEKSWTSISGQFSEGMRKNALMAIGIALVAILCYIAIRFELKYALSSVVSLMHNAFMTFSVVSLAFLLGVDLQFNLEAIGALLTIFGFVLNDTIIVFDRVREVASHFRKRQIQEIVNMSLNQTLSRTIMTCLMTLSALFALLLFGGGSIFTFTFIMFVGILLGPLSTFFVACPLLAYFHKREEQSESEA